MFPNQVLLAAGPGEDRTGARSDTSRLTLCTADENPLHYQGISAAAAVASAAAAASGILIVRAYAASLIVHVYGITRITEIAYVSVIALKNFTTNQNFDRYLLMLLKFQMFCITVVDKKWCVPYKEL